MTDDRAWREVESFYRRETMLLQHRRYREWLTLMDDRIVYRVPVTTSTVDDGLVARDGSLGYYDEDLELLKARVAKLESRQSWVEKPPSRLRYFVQVIECGSRPDGGIVAISNLLLLQHRWNMEQQFSGERSDAFVAAEGGLRLVSRTVLLDRQTLGNQGLSVFF